MMGFFDFLFTGMGLAMDAAAVSAAHGMAMTKLDRRKALFIALAFGIAQGLMPLTGYLLGSLLAGWLTAWAKWVAFGLLALVGGKMIWDNLRGGSEDEKPSDKGPGYGFVPLVMIQAVLTSIDALAVGISFAALRVNILYAAGVIAGITVFICFLSVWLGRKIGTFLAGRAQLAGGIILILIAIKIVVV